MDDLVLIYYEIKAGSFLVRRFCTLFSLTVYWLEWSPQAAKGHLVQLGWCGLSTDGESHIGQIYQRRRELEMKYVSFLRFIFCQI